MARYYRHRPSIDLFPFLSIIVCVTGTVAFLIVVMAVFGTERGERKAEESRLRALLESRRRGAARAEALLREHADLIKALDRLREQVRAKEKRLAELLRLEREVPLFQARIDELSPGGDPKSSLLALLAKRKLLEAEIQRLERALGTILTKLKAARSAPTSHRTGEPEAVRVVFPTAASTELAPLFVECSASGLTVHPEGRFIAKTNISRSADYRVILDRVRRDKKLTLNFLVRPDGIDVFEKSRQIARDRSVRHGYVPVPGGGRIVLTGEDANAP